MADSWRHFHGRYQPRIATEIDLQAIYSSLLNTFDTYWKGDCVTWGGKALPWAVNLPDGELIEYRASRSRSASG